MTRIPVHREFDAIVEVHPRDGLPQHAWGSAKRSYRIRPEALALAAPEPLRHDIRDKNLEPRWPPGSDFWPFKLFSDVVVLGKAFGPAGRAIDGRSVSVRVGNVRKRIQVWGTRLIEWGSDGRPRVGAPDPFSDMDLVYTRAYGGRDARVPMPPGPSSSLRSLGVSPHHPGVYPRNQSGKGYVVIDSPIDGVELPNLEDPDNLLTSENIIVKDPALWYRQPLSFFLDWHYPAMFPRGYYAGASPYHPVPPAEVLEEVRRGFVPEQWRDFAGQVMANRPPPPIFFQEASLGMSFSDLREGTPLELEGMHPERDRMTFALPAAPRLVIEVEGDKQPVEAKILHVVITPHEEKVEITWAGIRKDLPRAFFPGIHGHIPITLYVDGAPVPYDTPEPIYPKIRQAEAEGKLKMPRRRRPGEPGYLEMMAGLLTDETPRRERDVVPKSEAPHLGDVDVANGRLLLEEVDFEVPGPYQLAFRRFYSSSMTWRAGSLGVGWSHCLEQALWEEDGWLYYRTENGREIAIPVPRGRELALGSSVHHPLHGVTVRRLAGDQYEVRLTDGRGFQFTRIQSSVTIGTPKARLTRCFSSKGASVELAYDAHGRLDRLLFPSGQYLRFEHDERSRLTRIFAPTRDGSDWAVAARYEIDGSGQLREAADGMNRGSTYRYHGRLLVQHTSRTGLVRRFAYDGPDAEVRCVRETWGEDAPEREYYYSAAERNGGVRDACEHSFSFRCNPAGSIVRVLDYFANETSREHDEASGLVTLQRTKNGETSYLYDASFHLADVSAPDQGSVALEHDEAGHLTQWKDAEGGAARWAWDVHGRLAAVADRSGASVVYGYEEDGVLSSILAPGDAHIAIERDKAKQTITALHAIQTTRRAQHDALSRIIAIEDELGTTTKLSYDPSGRVAKLELAGDLLVAYESDADGNVTEIHAPGLKTTLERDLHGRIAAVLRAGVGPRLHRDAEGRVKMVENEALDLWELIRDTAGRVIEEAGFEGMAKRYSMRDHDGHVRREVCGLVSSEVTRDGAGRPLTIRHSDESFQRFAWTNAGHLERVQEGDGQTRFERDGEGRITLEKRRFDGIWIKSDYGGLGRRFAMSSALGLSVRVDRDAFGRARSYVAQRGEQRLELHFERDRCGREVRRHLPGGLALVWTRDALGRPTERSIMRGAEQLATARYSWDGIDRLVRFEDPARGARRHRYDARSRLIQAGRVVRVLDDVDNVFRTEARDDHRYAVGGRVLQTRGIELEYDEVGRRIEMRTADAARHRYRWDARGRLVEVSLSDDKRIVYAYDGLGRRIARRLEQKTEISGVDQPVWDSLSETLFVWDGLELLHEIENGVVTTWLWDEGCLVGKLDDRNAYAALTDSAGMPAELTDANGDLAWRAVLDCYGLAYVESSSTPCPWRFRGHWADPDTGLLHSWLRVYDPQTGSYLSPNPLGIAAGANLYTYVSDPLVESSPLGLGPGYTALAGALRSERLEGELIERFVRALDRDDSAAGPRSRFDVHAATPRLPNPEALLFGAWERFRPSRQLPPPSSSFTRLPESTGLVRS